MKNKVTAVLLAGGKGTRFDPDNLKTLHKIDGMTLTEKVILDIKKSKLFDEIILVYNSNHKEEFLEIANRMKIIALANGNTRFLSATNGAKGSSSEKIIFIDVAAPFYQHKMLKEMIDKLDQFNGVMTTVFDKRADHVYVENGIVKKVFARGEILRVKSYQGVKKTNWLNAIALASKEELSTYTEMLNILIDNNNVIASVSAENNPRKITTKDDLRFF